MGIRSMSKLSRVGLAAMLCFLPLAGCGSVRLQTPDDRDMRLLEEEEPATVYVKRRIWFALWGNAALSDDSPAPEIEEHDLKEIRLTSYQSLLDTAINMVGGIVSIVCRTMVVEGNP